VKVALGKGLEGALPKQKEHVTVIGTLTMNDAGYTLTVEAVKRGDAVIIGKPKTTE
jgi:predicted DNA repair protein MutK